MDINLHNITIAELTQGYQDNGEAGVVGYGGKLDIRPPYQREFVYDNKKRDAVIESVMNRFPLNTMYWFDREDGTYEVIDGQQRTISIAQYIEGDFSVNNEFTKTPKHFHNLLEEERKQILGYALQVYVCHGTPKERLQWFETINIQGEHLTPQELRNAIYAGKWTANAKILFSKHNCKAYRLGKDYLPGRPIRQEFLETALNWISHNNPNEYMAKHQHDETAEELWEHFRSVIDWVKRIFPKYRVEMKGLEWGTLYNKHKDDDLDPDKLEAECAQLMEDEEVAKKRGIYFYLLTREEKHLNLRAFSKKQKRELFEKFLKAGGKCRCGAEIKTLKEAHADHIKPWSDGGRTEIENGQILCRKCNQRKSDK